MSKPRVTQALQALNDFFSAFLPAYAEGCAPDAAALPYITYRLAVPATLGEMPFYARVWHRAPGYEAVAAVLDDISAAIGPGCCLPTESGDLWLYKQDPFLQFLPQPDPHLKCAYLNMKLSANL